MKALLVVFAFVLPTTGAMARPSLPLIAGQDLFSGESWRARENVRRAREARAHQARVRANAPLGRRSTKGQKRLRLSLVPVVRHGTLHHDELNK